MSRGGPLDKIPVKKPGDKLPATEFNALVTAVRAALNITGPSVIADSSGTYIGDKRSIVQDKRWRGRVTFIGDIGENRWVYAVEEVFKKSPGYDGWETKPNGRQVQCFNLPEDQNSDSGVQGTGIDVGNLLGGFAHQPVPVGSIVEVTEVRVLVQPLGAGQGGPEIGPVDPKTPTNTEYWIDRMNGVDGSCGPPPP